MKYTSKASRYALTGEGSDEAMAGYVWFKTNKMMRWFDFAGFRPSVAISRLARKMSAPHIAMSQRRNIDRMFGGPHAQSEMYNFVALSRHRFYSREMKERLGTHLAYEDLPLDMERMKRWHPLNRSLYIGYKTMLCGMLLNHKGDRVAMANSVEFRYPFLDDDVIKLSRAYMQASEVRRARYDKYLLRGEATRYLPEDVAMRRRRCLAPLAESFFAMRRRLCDG